MTRKVKSRNGKFYKVKKFMLEADENGIYSAAFTCDYKLFNILSNPNSDILGVQAFSFWKPCTKFFENITDEIPEYQINGKIFSIQFQISGM